MATPPRPGSKFAGIPQGFRTSNGELNFAKTRTEEKSLEARQKTETDPQKKAAEHAQEKRLEALMRRISGR